MIDCTSRATHASALVIALLCFAGYARASDGAPGEQGTGANGGEAGARQADPERARARALELFQQSSALYEEGDFRGAVVLLERAYAIFPEPILIYNMGRAQEGLGNDEDAITAYEKYLAEQPEAKERGAIMRRLQTLKARVDERRRRAADASNRPLPVPTTSRAVVAKAQPCPDAQRGTPGLALVPWAIAGVGTLSIASGAVLWLLANEHHDRAASADDVLSARSEQNKAESLALSSSVAFVGGSILTAAGAAWGIVTLTSSRSDNRTTPRVGVVVAPGAVWISGHL